MPAHPVAGTENSGPAAGFATLFDGRWCIVTPAPDAPADAVAAVTGLWQALGAKVETMDAAHHDMVLAVTSHLPHLIAYTIVGTASELEEVTESEVIKYSAGGFRSPFDHRAGSGRCGPRFRAQTLTTAPVPAKAGATTVIPITRLAFPAGLRAG